MLPPVLGALEQFQIGLQRQETFRRLINKPGGLNVSPLNPDKDIGIKDHGNAPLEDHA
jgi:hypothetical protein